MNQAMTENPPAALPSVMIVLVNWNRHQDTLACLDSLLQLQEQNWFVVLCDNGSADGSAEQFRLWAGQNGRVYRQISTAEMDQLPAASPACTSLTCIASEENMGFAAANNWALAYALRLESVQYVWLLNNDTTVDPAALSALLLVAGQNGSIGMCGSTVLEMDNPRRVQCYGGGQYDFWTGWTRHIGEGAVWARAASSENLRRQVEQRLDFVYGASMLVSRRFLQEIGLMSEEYFLYFEELDWALRAKGCFQLGYAPDSLVWHRGGSSTLLADKQKSELADYYMLRNRVLFTLRHHHHSALFIFAGLLVSFGNRLCRGQAKRIPLLLRAVADGVRTARKQGQ